SVASRRTRSVTVSSARAIGTCIVAPLDVKDRGVAPGPGPGLPRIFGNPQPKPRSARPQRRAITEAPVYRLARRSIPFGQGTSRSGRSKPGASSARHPLTRPGAGRTFRISVYWTEIREPRGGRGSPPLPPGGCVLRMLVLGAGLQGSACAYD